MKRIAGKHWVSVLLVGLVGCEAYPTGEPIPEDVGTEESAVENWGDRLSQATIVGLLRDAGFAERLIPGMVCAAKYESDYWTGRKGHNIVTRGGKRVVDSTDWGLFQINDKDWDGDGVTQPDLCGYTTKQLLQPRPNAMCAKQVYDYHQQQYGDGFNGWRGYTSHRTICRNFKVDLGDVQDQLFADGGRPCYSNTQKREVEDRTCLQAASDMLWYQCNNGVWSQSVQGNSGAAGACLAVIPYSSSGATCYSNTLARNMNEGDCVQGASDQQWYQCKDGLWYEGLTNRSGVSGACVGYYPL